MSSKDKYTVDVKTADMMLQNVFNACDQTPNKIPFEKLVERTNISYKSEHVLIILCSVLFAITFFIPLFFPHSRILMSVNSEAGRGLTISSHEMTDDSFSISFDSNALDVSRSYMEDENGLIVTPSSYDRSTNTITFPYVENEYNIYVYDVTGKCIHMLLTPYKLAN